MKVEVIDDEEEEEEIEVEVDAEEVAEVPEAEVVNTTVVEFGESRTR